MSAHTPSDAAGGEPSRPGGLSMDRARPASTVEAKRRGWRLVYPDAVADRGTAAGAIEGVDGVTSGGVASGGEPIREATDPRWVLAVRTAEQLQGTVLPPEDRERLLRLGRVLGLSPFDSNLVIAIVQDQVRRGQPRDHCADAGAAQLAMVPRPRGATLRTRLLGGRAANIAWFVAGLVGLELAVLLWVF